MMQEVRIGIIGGGLMGREIAACFARWCALTDVTVRPVLTAVADLNPAALAWFEAIPGCTLRTTDYHELIHHPAVDVVYAAVPHNLHEQVYLDTLAAGKDLLAEKPFGLDLAAARNILAAVRSSGRFVRCSSEMPFFRVRNGLWNTRGSANSGGFWRWCPGSTTAAIWILTSRATGSG